MEKMFCFQCEQTAGGQGCTVNGVCGKRADIANLQDQLIDELIKLACTLPEGVPDEAIHKLLLEGLFTTLTNVNFDEAIITARINQVIASQKEPPAVKPATTAQIWQDDADIRSLKALLIFGLKGMAAYAHHSYVLGRRDSDIDSFFYKALRAVGYENTIEALLPLVMSLGQVNLQCMALLSQANRETYGQPEPTTVPLTVEEGPFIVVTGHDLRDLALLLEQTKDKGISVYTHGEMLPAHAYPKLKAYSHLKGHFGTAWQNQQSEFAHLPAPILYTTNCIMPVRESYHDRVFTTAVVGYPQMQHIGEDKDFTPVIEKALALGGFTTSQTFTGLNGGTSLTTGFGHEAVLAHAPTILEAVKSGAIKHFFLVGGCDGSRQNRSYYTEFVQKAPADSVILTLACGKFRFNDLNLGQIGGLPRLMDMGQCNDAYSAIQVAAALADAFACEINDLPLTLVLSWYEQKAVCILLTLLALGIKNIYLGPTLPAFVSNNILKYLIEQFNITPISTAETDLQKILG